MVSAGPANVAAQSVHAQDNLQGSPVHSSGIASKGTLKGQLVRKSGGRKKTTEASGASQAQSGVGQSGVGSSSKSPAGKKKRGQAGLDKEAKEALKAMDTKIEELRKQTFGNVNRLDAKLDDLQAGSNQAQQQLSTTLREEQGRLHA